MFQEFGFWIIQIPGWCLFTYLAITQCLSALNYNLGVRLGFQDSEKDVTEIGRAFWWGFAAGDLLLYTPLLGLGLIGHWHGANWSEFLLSAAFGITAYWTVVCLAAVRTACKSPEWKILDQKAYWIVLPIICLWGVCGLSILISGI